jgi:hypothetical protein
MKILDLILAADGRIAGGSEFQWQCFGPNARYLDFCDLNGIEYAHGIFDAKTQHVYMIHLEIPEQQYAYQWIDHENKKKYLTECKARCVDPDVAWDEVTYRNIGSSDKMLSYLSDIGNLNYQLALIDSVPVQGSACSPIEKELWGDGATDPNCPWDVLIEHGTNYSDKQRINVHASGELGALRLAEKWARENNIDNPRVTVYGQLKNISSSAKK